MHINEHTKIIGQRVILVPYCKCHVAKYHTWMEDEELRRLTASERLSLEEEYEMQARWHEDEDKCTFIVLARDLIDSGADEIAGMVGDVNIFINGSTGELTTMIAESKWRRKGLGEEAVRMMLRFAFQVIGLRAFEVKISNDNVSSLKLFQKIGFVVNSQCSKFREYTLSIGMEHILKAIAHLEVTVDKYHLNDDNN
ncbi:acetyltransferase [Loa loa]|uniref:Acetyltransferase n=1 Tax=Loa loa TaxID=7209 RepID=A0A1S0TUM3_LOALO|nr:acetyltransferase [Loa loa]EFO20484.1 acetyltransferase [Loa loa]